MIRLTASAGLTWPLARANLTYLAGPHTLWPDVTSPVARRVLSYLFNLGGCMSDRAGVSNYGEGFTQEHIAYALWIRQHLRQSTISQQLAAGTYTIPDLSGRIPVWSAFNLRLFPPKTVEQYTAFIVEHLALLLGPSPLPVSVAPMPWSMIVFLTLPYVLSILMFIQAKLSKWLGATSALVFLGAFALLYVTATIGQWKTLLGQGPPTRLSIHLTELYWYLRQAYSDNPPGDDELPDPAKPRL